MPLLCLQVKGIEGVHVKTICFESYDKYCFGIAVNASETLMAVACNYTELYLYSVPGGELLRTIGEVGDGPGQFSFSRRVCFGPEDVIIVADMGNNRVQEFSADGKYRRDIVIVAQPWAVCLSNDQRMIGVSSVDSGAHSIVLLEYPSTAILRTITGHFTNFVTGMRFTNDDTHILVTSKRKTNVDLLSVADGLVVKTIPTGLGSGGWNDVCFTTSGDVIATDSKNNKICVFSLGDTTLQHEFGREGVGNGQFKSPTALSYVNGRLYVLDHLSPRVQVFT